MKTINEMLTPEVLKSFESSIGATTESELLPAFVYSSEEFYEKFEKEAIFGHEWLCVGRESWLPQKGDYFTTSYIDEPLIVVRTDSNEIKCLSAVCQHRGMLVAEGSGNCNFFRCPYHHWVYDLEGALAGAPAMDKTVGFDRKKVSLPSVKTDFWNGFIFINFDPEAKPLRPRLARFDRDFEHYDLANGFEPGHVRFSDLPWNWKVMFENTNDGYHANRLHKGPMHDFCPSNLAYWSEYHEDDAAVVRYTGFTHKDAAFNPTLKCLLPIFPNLTDEERTRMVFINLPPTLWVACLPDQVFYFLIHPDGARKCWIDQGPIYHPKAPADPLFEPKLAVYRETFQHFNHQDRYVDTLVQRGLGSRFARRGRLSHQEESLARFARWLVQRYRDRWPSDTPAESPKRDAARPVCEAATPRRQHAASSA